MMNAMTRSVLLRRLPLLLLLLAALLMRLQGWFPFHAPDEDMILNMAWGLHVDPFPPGLSHGYPGYPPLFVYLIYLLSLLCRKLLVFMGVFASAGEFVHSPLAQSLTLKAGQVMIAFLGAWHVYLVWRIGREFIDARAAWLAGLVVAFHPDLVLYGHIFKSDLPLAVFFALLLWFVLRFLRRLETRDFYLLCFAAGLTTACKYNGAVEVLLVPVILWIVRKRLPAGRWRRLLLLSPLCGLLGFLAGAPHWIVHPVANFRAAWDFTVMNFQEYTFYDPLSSTYHFYLVDLWRTLGPVFAILFFMGVFLAFWRRRGDEIVIALSVLLYFLLTGASGFYSSRVILPLYGGVALIVGKTAFRDLLPLLERKYLRRAFTAAVFLVAALLCLGNVRDSLTRYNLWQSASTWDEALNFRREHIPAAFSLGRETFTPMLPGDRGRWDITDIGEGLFHGPQALPFLHTGLLTDYILTRSRNPEVKENLRSRLREYRVFHRVHKPRFSQWDGDILFWYRPHPQLLESRPGKREIALPRLFRQRTGGTLFYPLQPYERDPGFFRLQGPHWGKWILSSRPLSDLSLTLFSPEGDLTARFMVGGGEVSLTAARGTATGLLPAPRPLPFQESPAYRIEAELPADHPPAFLLVREVPRELPGEPLRFASPLEGEPPPLFSAASPPGWVKEFFRRTGIDLSLLAFTQEMALRDDAERSLSPFVSEWAPLVRGAYRWEIETEPLARGVPAAEPPPLGISLFAAGRFEQRELAWERLAAGRFAALLEIRDECVFLQARSGDLRQRNLLLLSLRFRPDYLRSLRLGLVRGVGRPEGQ